MRDRELYAKILGLAEPWVVADVELDVKGLKVLVRLTRRAGATLSCPECGRACPGYDAQPRRWRQSTWIGRLGRRIERSLWELLIFC